MSTLDESASDWNRLANEQEAWGDYEAASGRFDGVARNKAALYRRTVVSLVLESEHGVSHCVCCLKPRGEKR